MSIGLDVELSPLDVVGAPLGLGFEAWRALRSGFEDAGMGGGAPFP